MRRSAWLFAIAFAALSGCSSGPKISHVQAALPTPTATFAIETPVPVGVETPVPSTAAPIATAAPVRTAASVATAQPAAHAANTCGAPQNPWGYNFCGRGGYITNPPSDFCSYFDCIDNFPNGKGYVVQCIDGRFSKSGGRQGACSYHGGEKRPLYSGP